MTLVFPNLKTLQAALASGVVPIEVASAPAEFGGDGDAILIRPSVPPPNEAIAALGVGVSVQELSLPHKVCCWPQTLPLVRANSFDLTAQSVILFDVSSERQWTELITEHLRLGNDRMTYRSIGPSRWLLKVIGPPYYSLLRAIDPAESHAPRAFIEVVPHVWIQYGFSHPFAQRIQPASGQCLLLSSPNDWEVLPDVSFQEIGDVVEIAPPTERRTGMESPSDHLITVPLTLTADGASKPALWVFPKSAMESVDDFVAAAHPHLLVRLDFVVTGDFIVLRLRPSRRPSPELRFREAVAYQPFRGLPNLFITVSTRLQPPLRRETLRRILANDPAIITWIESSSDGAIRPIQVLDDAFRPLSAWIDDVLERGSEVLDAWVQSSQVSFDVPQLPRVMRLADTENQFKSAVQKPKTPRPTPKRPAPATRRPAKPPDVPAATSTQQSSMLENRLAELEQQFLDIDGPLDHPERQHLWPEIARINAALGRPAAAALAWSHAVWETGSSDALVIQAAMAGEDVGSVLATGATPAEAQAAALAIFLTGRQRPAVLRDHQQAIQAFLQSHDHVLPVRIAWLAWSASCRAVGDILGLVRARDRMLNRLLHQGLQADVDLPAFLRLAGRGDAVQLRQIHGWLQQTREHIEDWIAKDLGKDHPTSAYVKMMFAFAAARLGESNEARRLVQAASTELMSIDDDTLMAHAFLAQAFEWRVEQVLAGRRHAGPLPRELLDNLAESHRIVRQINRELIVKRSIPYAIERFREQSRILDPHEKLDPYRHTRVIADALVRQATGLSDLRDSDQLADRIDEVTRRAGAPELLVRVLAACLPLAGSLSTADASRLLERVAPALDAAGPTTDLPTLETRLQLVERSLFFAAHFDRPDLARSFVDRLLGLFRSGDDTSLLSLAGPTIAEQVLSHRRLGLRDQTERMLDRIDKLYVQGRSPEQLQRIDPRRWPTLLSALLHLAAGWRSLDQTDRASPFVEAARELILKPEPALAAAQDVKDYASLVSNYVTILALGPSANARERITELFNPIRLRRMPNTFSTGRFYSRYHLNIVEAVVLSFAGEDFAWGMTAKRWLDEDEYLIRRRIHAEINEQLARGV